MATSGDFYMATDNGPPPGIAAVRTNLNTQLTRQRSISSFLVKTGYVR